MSDKIAILYINLIARLNYYEHMVNALAISAEEGRGKLR